MILTRRTNAGCEWLVLNNSMRMCQQVMRYIDISPQLSVLFAKLSLFDDLILTLNTFYDKIM